MAHSRDNRRVPGIKRPYLNLPSEFEGKQSYCITIPGGLQNKLVLIDLLGMACLWFNWGRTAGNEGKIIADAWRDTLNLPELEMCCCNDQIVLHRVTDSGALEISTDGGLTWMPDPADPRINGTSLPNTIPGAGADKKCNGATNAINNFKDTQAAFGHNLTTATTVIGLAIAIAGEIIVLLLSAGTLAEVLVPLVITTATTLFGVLESDYNAEFTEAVWDLLLCDLYCTIGNDGQYTEGQLINLQALVDTDFSDYVALTLQSILRGWGTKGLNNACISGTAATADCSECGCSNLCADKYQIWSPGGYEPGHFGTILEQDGDRVRVQFNSNYIVLESIVLNDCCVADHWELVSGGAAYSTAYNDCGSPFTGAFQHEVAWEGQCCYLVQMQALGEDRPVVDIFFSADC